MTKKAISIYMAITSAIAIIVPGRFAIGLVLALEEFLLMLFSVLFLSLLKTLKLKEMKKTLMLVFLVAWTILFKQILSLVSAEMALQLSFIIYLPAISSFSTAFLIEGDNETLKDEFFDNLSPTLLFSVYIVVFSLIRDVFGYGTITFPAFGRMKEIVIFPENYVAAGTFIATIPGAFILCALILTLFLKVEDKFRIMRKTGE